MRRRAPAALCLLLALALLAGCGPYKVAYRFPSRTVEYWQGEQVLREHAHGIGPLLVGGSVAHFLVQGMSPALIDFTGEVDLREVCPEPYVLLSQVEHFHLFEHNVRVVLASTIIIVNDYHPSRVVHTCVHPSDVRP